MSNILKLIVGLLVAVLLFSSCSPMRHYKYVRNDTYRTQAQRNLLAFPCSQEFPCKPGAVTSTTTGIDSSDYYAALDAYNSMIDQNIIQRDSIVRLLHIIQQAQGGLLDSLQVTQLLRATREKDSLSIIRNFLRWYKPKPIIQHQVDSVPYADSSAITEAVRKLQICQDNEEALEIKVEAANKWKTRFWIALGAGVLVVGLMIWGLINRQRKLTTVLKTVKNPLTDGHTNI